MGTLLQVDHLTIGYPEEAGMDKVVRDISFEVYENEILGVVGESGSGKSQTSLAVMGLLSEEAQILSGTMSFMGQELVGLDEKSRSRIQGNTMSMIFQEPDTSLNPVMKIGKQVGESLKLHTDLHKGQIREKVLESMRSVGLNDVEAFCEKYPHELSGGMRQRVMIAQAFICSPRLLIADEPTTALDVIVQAQILKLLKQLHKKNGTSILFISHDLNVIKEICDRVIVMYQGEIVEGGSTQEVLVHPKHDYTRHLVASMPGNPEPLKEKKEILQIRNMNIYYEERSRKLFAKQGRQHVVKDLNLTVYEGELLGIVGESGSGKSTLAKAIVGLNKDYDGQMILPEGTRPQMVFQDPFGSLNPARKIGWILSEPLRLRGIRDKKERKRLVSMYLKEVGLEESFAGRYARELSGGQRQRVSIVMALMMDSGILVADEPVSALDVTVQSQILDLLLDIHRRENLTILFISHDMNIVRHICHRVAVLYLGEIVELGDVESIYKNPTHPYTKRLIRASMGGMEEE